jgi:hypothetical protein
MAGDGVEAPPVLVEQQEHAVLVAEDVREPVDGGADQRVEVRAARKPSGELAEADGRRRNGFGHDLERRGARFEHREVEHAVDVRGAQLEHVLHAGERRDGVHIGAQLLEDLAPAFGALVEQLESVLVVVLGVDEQHLRTRVLGEVASRLREELVRQRDALVVDGVHAREVGDVRHALGGARRDHGRDGTAEATVKVRDGEDGAVRRRHRAPLQGVPARGPGVWLYSSSTSNSQATKLGGTSRCIRDLGMASIS